MSLPVRDRSAVRRVALVSLCWSAVIAATKLAVGVAIGSVAVLGDGFHSFLDLGASALTLAAVRIAARPPDREHPFGHGRAENLAALAEAFLMIVVAAGVALEAVRRIIDPRPFDAPLYALAVVGGTIVVDVWRVGILRRAAKRYVSPALEADAMNFTADIGESLVVLVGLGVVRLGFPAGDPGAALVVAVVMCSMAVRLAAAAINVLMDRTPDEIAHRVAEAASAVEGVVEVADPRVRRLGADVHAEVTVTVGRTFSVERSHAITEAIEQAVAGAVPGATTTVHVEPSAAGEDIVARTFAAANRVGLADQVHNVLAIRHPEGLWLMLHAKVPSDMELRAAHELSDELERQLRAEIDGLARVEIHLEPREPRHLEGRVVTAQRSGMVDDISRIAEAHPPIARCHEVAVTEAPDGLHLVLHCEAPADAPISAIHDASLEIEAEIHGHYPDVRSVTVHFEPSE